MGFKVKLQMNLEIDNKGANDITHNWSAGGKLRHKDVNIYI